MRDKCKKNNKGCKFLKIELLTYFVDNQTLVS